MNVIDKKTRVAFAVADLEKARTFFEDVLGAEFDSVESVDAWKSHPEHLAAQARGRQEFFQGYRTQVCTEVRAQSFP